VSEVAIGHTTEAIALTDNAVDTAWFQSTLKAASAVCYTLGRITFERPDGTPGKSPMRGQCFFYFGTNFAKFAEAFRHIGHVVELNKRAAAPANDAQEEPVGFGDIDAEDVEDALATDVAVPDEPIARGRDEILAFAGRIRAEEAKATREQNKALRQANPLPVVEGKYGTIVIDPPWPIEKIERDVRGLSRSLRFV